MGGLAQRDVVAVLTRAPSAGGKSRLFADLGIAADPSLLTALLLDTIDATALPDVVRIVAVEPDSACDEVRAIVPADLRVMSQPGGTLGDRMAGVMRTLFDNGARAVALVGSDLPALPAAALARAFVLLHDDPQSVVLGPASDGGYYLIAACHVPDLFGGIEWGTSRVLEQTQTLAARLRLRLHLVERTCDVDTLADLAAVVHDPTSSGALNRVAARTRDWARRRGIGMGKRPMIRDGNNLEPS